MTIALWCNWILMLCLLLMLSNAHRFVSKREELDLANLPDSEIIALYDLYESTNGVRWSWPGNGSIWNFSDPFPCSDHWQGVTCSPVEDDGNYHTIGLNLNEFSMNGSIPMSIGNLTKLESLILSSNRLNSTLPFTMGNLTALQSLDLSSNLFTGTLPDTVSSLQLLVSINIGSTLLTGTFPDVLCAIGNLSHIVIENSHFNGSLPTCYGSLNLTILELSSNAGLVGSIPDAFTSLHNLLVLDVNDCALTGSLPDIFGTMTSLLYLDVGFNFLTGTLPASLLALQNLLALYLFTNNLYGTVSSGLLSLPHLYEIDISQNAFSGPVELLCGPQTQLFEVTLTQNHFSGSLPETVPTCTALQLLYVDVNHLSGTIPDSLWNASWLSGLVLSGNQFSGTLSPALNQLSAINYLSLDLNLLSGTIPNASIVFGQVATLTLSDNYFSGTLPSSIFSSLNIYGVEVSSNLLSGTLPTFALREGGFSPLSVFLCADNKFTGTIPIQLALMPELSFVNMSYNDFTGVLPEGLATTAAVQLEFLYLSGNHLTGTIPTDWSSNEDLSFLYLDGNLFSGSIPQTLGNLPSLQSLNLSSNLLTGFIPTSFQGAGNLQLFMLQDNHLSGNIQDLFNADSQQLLRTVQLSNNQLTGTLPAEAFKLPVLRTFAAVSNCFVGSLPVDAICNSASLNSLVLDGMHSAGACRKRFSVSINGAYAISNALLGGLPACLFTMPTLTTLHLSGNGITGPLPVLSNISTALSDLSLSHNLLSGTLSRVLMERPWAKLDLSYNRITGTLKSCDHAPYGNDTTLYLLHNRLSGGISGSMRHVNALSILDSNLFSCRVDRSDIPSQDSNANQYVCGSDNVDSGLYVFLGLLIGSAVVTFLLRRAASAVEVVQNWWDLSIQSALPHLAEVHHIMMELCTGAAAAALFCMVVLLPTYAALSAYSGNYVYQYAWTLSGSFLSGRAAFGVMLTCLCLLLLTVVWARNYWFPHINGGGQAASAQSINGEGMTKPPRSWLVLYALFLSFNVVIVSGVNIAFVVAALSVDGRQLTFIQIALAIFKLSFNNVAAPYVKDRLETRTSATGAVSFNQHFAVVQLAVALFNNIVIPCLVVAVISPSCFYNIFRAAEDVSSSYYYGGACTQVVYTSQDKAQCDDAQLETDFTSYSPPFVYSYQCSSTFITYYAPAFVAMCVISAFVIPLHRVVLVWWWVRQSPQSRLHELIGRCIPRLLKSPASDDAAAMAEPNARLRRPVYRPLQTVLTLLTYLGLLLSFGALFPPLALCCTVAMVSVAAQARLMVGRYLAAAASMNKMDCGKVLDASCKDVVGHTFLSTSLDMIIFVSCSFYTLFLFDTLGDAVGFQGAYWVLIVFALLPIVAMAVRRVARRWTTAVPGKSSTAVEVSLEMEMGKVREDWQASTEDPADGVHDVNPLHNP